VPEHAFKYQEKVLADGSAVILNENGVIEAYDADGNLSKTCAPGDPDWQSQAANFELAPPA
jgi:hypothetical protein